MTEKQNKREFTKQISVGGVLVGGGAPVSVQTMCSTKTWDVEATVSQIRAMQAAGADIVRIAIPDMEAAKAVSAIKEQVSVPLVADIHFDYRLALEAAARGIDKIRINPGNIGAPENVKAVAEACKRRHIPIRIGVNAGSLEKRLLEKYGHPCAEAMVESAKGHVELLNRYDFDDICLSLKTSSVPLTVESYRLAAETFDYPLHLGVTETGTEWNGTIQSAVGIGTLLCEGIGNTIRVSLTADPVREVSAGIAIVKAAGLRPRLPDGRPGAGGLRGHRHRQGRGPAPRRGEVRLLPHLRPDGDRPDLPGLRGGGAGQGYAAGHHRCRHGLRGQRPGRGPGGRLRHRRRQGQGPAVQKGRGAWHLPL